MGKPGPPKGQTNNPNGRPKGSKNERSKQWDELGEAIATKHAERLNRVLDQLDDEKFVTAYKDILNYFKPRLSSSSINANVSTSKTDISDIFPDEQEI